MDKNKVGKKQLSVSESRFGVVLESINFKLDLILQMITNTLVKLEKYGN